MLDAWCALLLGPASATTLMVEGQAGASHAVLLSSLGISAIDVVMACRNDGAELEERAVQAGAGFVADGRVRRDRAWKDLVGLGAAIARVITRAEVLRPEALEPPSALAAAAAEDSGDLATRVDDAVRALTGVRDALVEGRDIARIAAQAAAFGIRVPGLLLGSEPTPEQQGALLASIEARIAAADSGTPRDRLRGIFGGDLPGVVPFVPRDAGALVTAQATPPASLFDGDPLAARAWLDAIGRTRPAAAALGEVLLRMEVRGDPRASQLLVAQAPWTDGDRWIATSFTSNSGRKPDGRMSVLMHAPAGVSVTQPLGGLLVDAWTETVPSPTHDTAMALRFNNASARAPQAILLAVSPDPSKTWTTETVISILRDTLTLTRMRALPAVTYSRGGLMPFAWLGQRSGGKISFSL